MQTKYLKYSLNSKQSEGLNIFWVLYQRIPLNGETMTVLSSLSQSILIDKYKLKNDMYLFSSIRKSY